MATEVGENVLRTLWVRFNHNRTRRVRSTFSAIDAHTSTAAGTRSFASTRRSTVG